MTDDKYWAHVRLTMPLSLETVGHAEVTPEDKAEIEEFIRNKLGIDPKEMVEINTQEGEHGER